MGLTVYTVYPSCLTVNPQPDLFLAIDPSGKITMSFGLLLASTSSCTSAFPAGYSRQRLPRFSGSRVS